LNPLKRLINQTAIYGLSSIIGRLLNYLLVPLYTRYFTPSEYGVVTEMYAYVAFLVIILTYGMETAFFRFSQKSNTKKTVYSTTLISIIITSIFFIIITLFYSNNISYWIGYENNIEYIQWFAIIVALDAVSAIPFAYLRSKNKALKFATIRLINIFINIGLNLYFVIYKGFGVEYIFIANLISSSIMLFLLIPTILKSNWKFDKSLWKKMIFYAIPLLIAGFAGIVNETLDRVLLKHLLVNTQNSLYEIGLYGAFYKLSIIMILFIQTFRYAAEPFFFSQEKEENAKKNYAIVMKYFVIVTAVIFLTVTVFYDLIKGFLGSQFHDERGFVVVSLLLLANMFLGIYYNLSIWYKLTEKTKYGAYMSITGAMLTIILNIILIPKIGFIGCAWTTLICYFSMTIISYFLGKKQYPIPYEMYRLVFYFILMLSLFLASQKISLGMFANSIYILIFVAVAIYVERKNLIKKEKNETQNIKQIK